jgi:uncharacterized protein (UPF0332 family)
VNEAVRRRAIADEMRRSRRALEAAELLRDRGLYDDALSRLYYALFHAMCALLVTAGVEPKRHRALPHLLGTHLSSDDGLSAADLAVVARAATHRELADYERTWEATRAIADQAFAEVAPLIDRARERLTRDGWWTSPSG